MLRLSRICTSSISYRYGSRFVGTTQLGSQMVTPNQVLQYFDVHHDRHIIDDKTANKKPSQAEFNEGLTQLVSFRALKEANMLLDSMDERYQLFPSRDTFHGIIGSFGGMNMKKRIQPYNNPHKVSPSPIATKHKNNQHFIKNDTQNNIDQISSSHFLQNLLNHMRKSYNSQPTTKSYNLILRATIDELKLSGGKFINNPNSVNELISTMYKDKVEPDIQTFNSLLMYYRMTKDSGGANKAFRRMVINGNISPNTRSLQIMLGIHGSGSMSGADNELPSNLYLLTHWLAACFPDLEFNPSVLNSKSTFQIGKDTSPLIGQEYATILKRASNLDFPDSTCFNVVIKTCGQKGKWEAALGLLETMDWLKNEGNLTEEGIATKPSPISPDVITVGSTMDACSRSGKWEEAIELLRAMKQGRFGDFSPNLICYNTVINACANANRTDEALELFWEMTCDSVEDESIPLPDLSTFESILTMLASSQELDPNGHYWKDSLSILALMPVNISKIKFIHKPNLIKKQQKSISSLQQKEVKQKDDEEGDEEGDKGEEYEVVYQESYRRFFEEFESRLENGDVNEEQEEEQEEIDWTSSENMFDTPEMCLVSPEAPLAHNAVLRTLASAHQWEYALTLLLEMWRDGFPAPDKHSFSTVIQCLVACNRNNEAVALFRSVATIGVYALWVIQAETPLHQQSSQLRNCWPLTEKGGLNGWILDLHGCNKAVASVAFQTALQSRLHFYMSSPMKEEDEGGGDETSSSRCFDDLIVIIGKGIHSQQQGSSLGKHMVKFINQTLNDPKINNVDTMVVVEVMENNPGRLIVSGTAIERWVRHHHAKALNRKSGFHK